MFYFSQLKNSKVITERGAYVGNLYDLVFEFKAVPKVTKLVVRPLRSKESLFVPVTAIKKIDESLILKEEYSVKNLEENELYVLKNLVDKQIIDIEGRKVVRVNDVLFQPKKTDQIFIVGVDTSLSGIARWFKLEKPYRKIAHLIGRGEPHILPWSHIQPLELTEGKVVLNRQQERLEQFHPEDLADYLETTTIKNAIKTLNLVDREFAGEVIAELNLNYQVELFKKLTPKKATEIIALMDPDEAVDVLLQLTPKKMESVLITLEKEKQEELRELIKLSATPVGQYMTTEFMTVARDDSVNLVLRRILSETEHMDFLDYVYVVNNKDQLIGVFNMHELLMQKKDTPIDKFMTTDVIIAHLNTPLKLVFRKLIKYKISALPIVDVKKRILGIVTINDIGEVFVEGL